MKTLNWAHVLLALALFAVGTTLSSVETHASDLLDKAPRGGIADIRSAAHWLQVENKLKYAWTAFYAAAAVDVAVLSFVALRALHMFSVTDKVRPCLPALRSWSH